MADLRMAATRGLLLTLVTDVTMMNDNMIIRMILATSHQLFDQFTDNLFVPKAILKSTRTQCVSKLNYVECSSH